jgi:probable addiction module antidote protein
MEGVTFMEIKFRCYDPLNFLKTEEDIEAYLDAAMEDGDPALIVSALGDVARAQNLSQLARNVGMSRQGLDKAFSGNGNPSLATVLKVAQALGLRLSFKSAPKDTPVSPTFR